MPRWTTEQQEAIDKEGTNIIVSAGAGSGKTAVLTARVLRKVLNGVDVDRLLILTFTKAAANEMKERIRKALKKEPTLAEQLNKVDTAYITTFDSYALSVVKKYHYLLNVSPNISIGDSSVISIKKEELLDEIFNELYETKNEKFLTMIGELCVKDDSEIKKAIINISDKLDMRYDKREFLNTYLDKFYKEEKILTDVNKYLAIIKSKVNVLEKLKDELSLYVDGDAITKILDVVDNLVNAKSYEEYKMGIDTSLGRLPSGVSEEAKLLKEKISTLIKEINNLLIFENEQEIIEQINLTKNYAEVFIEIILKLDKKITEFKFNNDIYEFIDISKMAIQVLIENPEVAEELKYYFNEILLDEYQDTNDLQEIFINLIANNNVYMVGDIKQSIYRFRNANPTIFKDKYDNYSKGINGYKIDLNKNFRSRKEVLENINLIFDLIMDNNIGGAEYQESHRMIFGNNTYINEGLTDQNYNFVLYNYPYTRDSIYTKDEMEIFIIASDIKEKVENHYQVFDKDEQILRDITYDDFAILLDRSSKFYLYKQIFSSLNIPLTILQDESITSEVDLFLLKNILLFILNIKNKTFNKEFSYTFTSIARSYLYRYSDEEIFDIVTNNKIKETEIYQKALEVIEFIDSNNPSYILNKVLEIYPWYEKLITVGDVNSSLIRFNYLVNLSNSFEVFGYDIEDLTKYLDYMLTNNKPIKYNLNKENSNSCKIMTIHKSKGLEYHICYFPGLFPKFNKSDLKERFTYDNDYGLILPFFKEGIGTTVYKTLLKEKYNLEEVSEKIRLFYVALTRAKEKMIFVAPLEDIEEEITDKESGKIVDDITRLNYDSFLKILNSIIPTIKPFIENVDLNKIYMTKDYNLVKNNDYKSVIEESNEKIIVEHIKFQQEEKENKTFSKQENKLITKEIQNNMKFGTKVHTILEYLDFKNPNLDLLEIDSYLHKKLEKLINLEIFNNKEDLIFYKEYEFIDDTEETSKHGIIDLLVEDKDKFLIVDYKLKNIDDSAYHEQLNGYREYLSKKTNKKVEIYLYSILDEKLQKI